MFDIGSFVDYWIVNELMGNQEIKHPKSFYIHKPRGGKLTAGPVWDFDYGTLTLADAERWMVRESSMWYSRLFQSRAIRRQARERWEALYPFLATVPTTSRRSVTISPTRRTATWRAGPRSRFPMRRYRCPTATNCSRSTRPSTA